MIIFECLGFLSTHVFQGEFRVKKAIRSTIWKGLLGLSFAVMILFFNNCKGKTEGALNLDQSASLGATSDETGGSGATGTLCEQDIKNLYARGWQQFLRTNCTVCHSSGPGKGRFANPDLNTAFAEFQSVGYVKVASNSVNPSHNPPYSGVQHTQAVNELKVEWQTGLQQYATCTGDPTVIPQESQIEKITLRTSAKAIGAAADGVPTPITFDLNTEISRIKGTDPLASVPGAKFTIYVTRLKNAGGFTYYTFSSPKVSASTVDVQIEGVFISVNSFLLNYPTTFSYIDKGIRAGSTNTGVGDISGLLSTGSLVAPKVILPTDTLTVSFINITKVTLPPPPPPIAVEIVGAKTVVVPKGASYIDLNLSLSAVTTEPVVVTVSENNDLCGTAVTLTNSNTFFRTVSATAPACLPDIYNAVCPSGSCVAAAKDFGRARSVIGATYNRFDWDYKLPANTVTFNPNETVKTIRVYFSQDIRNEKNRVLTLDIASVLGSVNIGTNKTVNYILNKYDNVIPDPDILTFTQLMYPTSGILGQNCVKCHNSTDNAGGYNMTDYQLMIDRRVLIPGDVNSKMYVRMHPNPEFLAKPMPQDGFLMQPLILEVEKWLLDGAKNN